MALHKIKDFYPDYPEMFGDHDIVGYGLYADRDDHVGSVDNVLIDDNGKIRYLVVSTGIWIFGKNVLLPIGRARVDYNDRRVYVDALTREQVEQLPTYNSDMVVDSDYEDHVRGVYSPHNGTGRNGMSESDIAASKAAPGVANTAPGSRNRADVGANASTGKASQYDRDPDLYNLNEKSHGTLKLHEERLIADKLRQKKGEVSVGKHVETQQANVSVPVSEERVVIERNKPSNAGQKVNPGKDAFREGEVARVEVYEETADIHKDTVVTEEVNVRKVVDRDTVDAQETLRKERLDVDRKATSEGRDPDRAATDPRNSRDSRSQRTTR
ncbi:MAG: DUF2382 domain-containing protein [Leptolyngbya sp. DLM2.Bin15]|nr:MAG: DUF2382 domain-containing protein [Leptolyngbya sp. DLM2.Bin15]